MSSTTLKPITAYQVIDHGTETVSSLMAGSSQDHEDYDDHYYYVSIRVK